MTQETLIWKLSTTTSKFVTFETPKIQNMGTVQASCTGCPPLGRTCLIPLSGHLRGPPKSPLNKALSIQSCVHSIEKLAKYNFFSVCVHSIEMSAKWRFVIMGNIRRLFQDQAKCLLNRLCLLNWGSA